MNKQIDSRFDELYGKEYYKIVRLTCPHYDELQDMVRNSIREYINGIRSGARRISVLELGVGTGETTKKILAASGLVTVAAVDDCQEMLESAGKNLAGYILEKRVELIRADALEYLRMAPAGTFDVFASAFTLHNLDAAYRSMVLKGIHRALKASGFFVNADKYAHDSAQQHEEAFQWQLALAEKKFDEINRPDLKKAALEHFRQDNEGRRLMREGDSKKEMARLGFGNIRTIYRERMEATIQATKIKLVTR